MILFTESFSLEIIPFSMLTNRHHLKEVINLGRHSVLPIPPACNLFFPHDAAFLERQALSNFLFCFSRTPWVGGDLRGLYFFPPVSSTWVTKHLSTASPLLTTNLWVFLPSPRLWVLASSFLPCSAPRPSHPQLLQHLCSLYSPGSELTYRRSLACSNGVASSYLHWIRKSPWSCWWLLLLYMLCFSSVLLLLLFLDLECPIHFSTCPKSQMSSRTGQDINCCVKSSHIFGTGRDCFLFCTPQPFVYILPRYFSPSALPDLACAFVLFLHSSSGVWAPFIHIRRALNCVRGTIYV